MADWGIKISQDGKDVMACSDDELVMSSKLNMLKTASVGLSVGAGSVAHGISYIPIFFTSVQSSGKGSIVGDDSVTTCDATNINLPATTKYYIFYQQAIL